MIFSLALQTPSVSCLNLHVSWHRRLILNKDTHFRVLILQKILERGFEPREGMIDDRIDEIFQSLSPWFYKLLIVTTWWKCEFDMKSYVWITWSEERTECIAGELGERQTLALLIKTISQVISQPNKLFVTTADGEIFCLILGKSRLLSRSDV